MVFIDTTNFVLALSLTALGQPKENKPSKLKAGQGKISKSKNKDLKGSLMLSAKHKVWKQTLLGGLILQHINFFLFIFS